MNKLDLIEQKGKYKTLRNIMIFAGMFDAIVRIISGTVNLTSFLFFIIALIVAFICGIVVRMLDRQIEVLDANEHEGNN